MLGGSQHHISETQSILTRFPMEMPLNKEISFCLCVLKALRATRQLWVAN